MLATLATGESRIRGFLRADDTFRSIDMMRAIGADVRETGPFDLLIDGHGADSLEDPDDSIFAGNSGTTMRIGCGVLAGLGIKAEITGDDSLSSRPMGRVIEPLGLMGSDISSTGEGGRPPIVLRGGPLVGRQLDPEVPSAQVKSAILLAGLFAEGPTTVTEKTRTRDHTERMLRAMGARIVIVGNSVTVHPAARLAPFDIDIPGDFSSAAFFLALAAAVPGAAVTLPHVGINPVRIGLLRVLRRMGADIRLESEDEVSGEPVADLVVLGRGLTGTSVTPEEVPSMIDEMPVLCAMAAMATGRTEVRGASELRVKESDRITTMVEALSRLGVPCGEYRDGLWIQGPALPREGMTCATNGDHRIAMSLMVLSAASGVLIRLTDTDCVDTSFPEFSINLDKLIE